MDTYVPMTANLFHIYYGHIERYKAKKDKNNNRWQWNDQTILKNRYKPLHL